MTKGGGREEKKCPAPQKISCFMKSARTVSHIGSVLPSCVYSFTAAEGGGRATSGPKKVRSSLDINSLVKASAN